MKIIITGGSGFIGTHLVEDLLKRRYSVLNIDINRPKIPAHAVYWKQCNILDFENLQNTVRSYQPTHIVHLAAETITDGKSLDLYETNTRGTANLLKAIKQSPSVSRVIITSTQHVRKPGSGYPKNDEDYIPYKAYGASKVITEQLTRKANLACMWTIIRPSTVWGPFHPNLPTGLWRIMHEGKYMHPKNDQVVRNYGYVGNVIFQIEGLLQAPARVINQQVFYVGDQNSRQIDWVNGFSKVLTGRTVREVPSSFLRLLALLGDGLRLIGVRFPMYTSRYLNLTTNNPIPIEKSISLLGKPPYSFENGVQETFMWLKEKKYI